MYQSVLALCNKHIHVSICINRYLPNGESVAGRLVPARMMVGMDGDTFWMVGAPDAATTTTAAALLAAVLAVAGTVTMAAGTVAMVAAIVASSPATVSSLISGERTGSEMGLSDADVNGSFACIPAVPVAGNESAWVCG